MARHGRSFPLQPDYLPRVRTVPVSNTWRVAYAVTTPVSNTRALPWQITGGVNNTWRLPYGIGGTVNATRALPWTVLSTVTVPGWRAAYSVNRRYSANSDYDPLVLATTGLSSYWKLNETSGQYQDSKSARNSASTGGGTTRGAPALVTGDPLASISVDGSAAGPNFGDVLDFPTAAPLTVEAIITMSEATAAVSRAIVSKWDSTGGQQGWLMMVTSGTNQLDFRMYRDGQLTRAQGGAIPQNTPTHIAVTFDGTSLRCYVNGALAAGPITYANAAGPLIDNVGSLYISGNPGFAAWLGMIQKVAIYNAALGATTIKEHSDTAFNNLSQINSTRHVGYVIPRPTYAGDYASLVLSRSGLQGLWRLDETTGNYADNNGNQANVNSGANVVRGALGLVQGDANRAMFVDSTQHGSGNFIALPAWNPGSNWSIVAWHRNDRTDTANNPIWSLAGVARGYSRDVGCFFGITIPAFGTEYTLQPSTPNNLGQIVQWVLTRNGARMTLYRNGVQVAQRTDLAAGGNSFTELDIFNNTGSIGVVDDLGLYNRELTAAEVAEDYNTGIYNLSGVNAADRLPWTDNQQINTLRALPWSVTGAVNTTSALPYRLNGDIAVPIRMLWVMSQGVTFNLTNDFTAAAGQLSLGYGVPLTNFAMGIGGYKVFTTQDNALIAALRLLAGDQPDVLREGL